MSSPDTQYDSDTDTASETFEDALDDLVQQVEQIELISSTLSSQHTPVPQADTSGGKVESVDTAAGDTFNSSLKSQKEKYSETEISKESHLPSEESQKTSSFSEIIPSLNKKQSKQIHHDESDSVSNLHEKLKLEEEISKIQDDLDKGIIVNQDSSPNETSKPDVEEDIAERLMEEEKVAEEDEDKKDEDAIAEEALRAEQDKMSEEELEELKEKSQALKAEGNTEFKSQSFTAAIVKYSEALQTCPLRYLKERSIMYSNRAACRLHLEEHDPAIEDCSKAIELNPNYLKAVLRRAELYQKTDKLDEALTDHQRVLQLDPSILASREACMRLPEQIKERNEKMKEEMMGKLKDLGNMILRPFGLSTNNFQLNQDPNSGGYSVNFVQNTPPPPQPPTNGKPDQS